MNNIFFKESSESVKQWKRYDCYKDSGVEWLGAIPEHWEVRKLKFLSKIKTGEKDLVNREKDGKYPLFVRSDTVEKINTYSYDEEAILTAGDGVGVGKVFHYYKGKFECHQRVYKISNFKKVTPKYLFFYIRENFSKEVLKISAKSTVDSLRLPMFLNFSVALPPLPEQKAIAQYLDEKTTKIDKLIAKKERLIELLQEKRTALISHVVTKGLNPDVPMKDSGVEWLGAIPEHWDVKKCKTIGKAIIGLTYSPSDISSQDEGILVLRSSNLQDGKISFNNNVFVKTNIPDSLITQINDILICSRNGSRQLIGKNALITEKSKGLSFGAFTTVFRSRYNKFIYYVFNSSLFEYQSGLFLTSTINQLTTSTLNNFQIPLPPLTEQKEIAQYLDEKTIKIDTLVNKTKQSIEKLQEYRTALISAAVTGKIDVREEITP